MGKGKVCSLILGVVFSAFCTNASAAFWKLTSVPTKLKENEYYVTEAYIENEHFFSNTALRFSCEYSYPTPSLLIKLPSLTLDLFSRNNSGFVSFFINTNLSELYRDSYKLYVAIENDADKLNEIMSGNIPGVKKFDSRGIYVTRTPLDFMKSLNIVNDEEVGENSISKEVNQMMEANGAPIVEPKTDNNEAYISFKVKQLENDVILVSAGNPREAANMQKLINLLTTENFVYFHFRQGRRNYYEKIDLVDFNPAYKAVMKSCESMMMGK